MAQFALLCTALFGCVVTHGAPAEQPAATETPAAPAPEAPVSEGAGGGACTSDADCVPAGCCHADSCVIKDEAPSCEHQMCTKECRFGTLDCGGQCLCQEGRCVAELSKPPAP